MQLCIILGGACCRCRTLTSLEVFSPTKQQLQSADKRAQRRKETTRAGLVKKVWIRLGLPADAVTREGRWSCGAGAGAPGGRKERERVVDPRWTSVQAKGREGKLRPERDGRGRHRNGTEMDVRVSVCTRLPDIHPSRPTQFFLLRTPYISLRTTG
jgi:hypothetical protein